MRIEVHLLHQSQPIVRENARNGYTKDGLYCVMLSSGTVEKYPLVHIFRVVEQESSYHLEEEPF